MSSPRLIWIRERSLVGWNTGFKWLRSGSYSKAAHVPYEIWAEKFGPDPLPSNNPDIIASILLSFTSEVSLLLSQRRILPNCTIQIAATGVVKAKDKRAARKNYKSGEATKKTLRTRRYEVVDREYCLKNLEEVLEDISNSPSGNAWLAVLEVTIHYVDNEGATPYHPRNAVEKGTD